LIDRRQRMCLSLCSWKR